MQFVCWFSFYCVYDNAQEYQIRCRAIAFVLSNGLFHTPNPKWPWLIDFLASLGDQ